VTRFICGIFLLVLAHPALAQVNPAFADVNAEIEMVRSLVRMERKTAVEQAMQLTPAESQAFWSVYNQYEAERTRVNDRAVKVVTDYAADADLLKLKKSYAKRFAKVLPPTRVARFFQIERKLDAVQNLSVAEQIPLIDR
jgi:hypothetical protein